MIGNPIDARNHDRALAEIAAILSKKLSLQDDAIKPVISRLRDLVSPDSIRPFVVDTVRDFIGSDELEVDDDASISWSSDGGAFVQAWVWMSDEELFRSVPHVVIELETADGCNGSEIFIIRNGFPAGCGIRWDAEPDAQTTSARFSLCNRDQEDVIEMDGDQWRTLESAGRVETFVSELLAKASVTQQVA